MILSDRDIITRVYPTDDSSMPLISPFKESDVQPASYDVHLSKDILVFDTRSTLVNDPNIPVDFMSARLIIEERPFILHPGEFALGSTLEYFEIPNDLAARIEGISSLGRRGLLVHATAGYVDPGFRGNLTIELSNVSPLPIPLSLGMRIGQISFIQLTSPTIKPYQGRYQDSIGIQPAR